MAQTDLINLGLLAAFHDELRKGFEAGDIDLLATNIASWEEADGLSVSDTWTEVLRTTAGSNPIETDSGGKIVKIIPKSDFSCSKLVTTGYNQLRLASDGGAAVAVGTGFYFPVPKLTFGEYGTAKENNGVLFTNSSKENMTPTVYFKPLSSGVPTSITDGTQLTAQNDKDTANENGGIYTDHGLKFYLTPGPGYLIVSGITHSETCAHIAWEDWYDKYVSCNDEDDGGDSITLSSIMVALHSDVNKMLVLDGGVSDEAEWTSGTNCKWTRKVGLINIKAYDADSGTKWTDVEDTVEPGATQTYTHYATITNMKSDGKAALYASGTALMVNDTTVSYQDTNEHAAAADVKFELDTVATGNLTINQAYSLNDCGIEMVVDASGEAFFTTIYACNITDWLAEFARAKFDDTVKVISEAFASLNAKIKYLEKLLENGPETINATNYKCMGDDMEISGEGAPSVVPTVPGQMYYDSTNSKWYKAKPTLSNSTGDWLLLN